MLLFLMAPIELIASKLLCFEKKWLIAGNSQIGNSSKIRLSRGVGISLLSDMAFDGEFNVQLGPKFQLVY